MNGKGLSESDESLIEEMEALQAIFSSELEITYSESGRPEVVTTTLYPATADEVSQKYVQLTVKICLPPQYPDVVPDITFHKPRGLSDDFLQEALRNCRQRCEEFIGNPMIYEITELLRESLTNSNRPTGSCAICLYNFVPEDVFTYTPCYHHYHSHCLLRYVMNVYKQWEEESRQEAETAQAHVCAKKEQQLQCPVCREPISVDLNLLRKAPPPLAASQKENVHHRPEYESWRKQMDKIYEKQKAQGGIIDCREEESRFLIVTDPCPSSDSVQETTTEAAVPQQQPPAAEPEIRVLNPEAAEDSKKFQKECQNFGEVSNDFQRIASSFLDEKKSREESRGEGSGVEIIVNEPYYDGPGGKGQYTRKIYHIGSHLPGWLKGLLPKSALIVEEEAWNAYPYTRTRYTCPFIEKFSLDIETVYKEDVGQQENVFSLNSSELRERIVDLIDVVRDQLSGSDYVKEEDPLLYVSHKTSRGPLNDNWINEYWQECKGNKLPLPNALRKTMLRAHRQAWAWQDEWFNLTMEDIREIERQTQAALAKTMNSSATASGETEEENSAAPLPAKNAEKVASDPSGNGTPVTRASSTSRLSSGAAASIWPISCISESSSDEEEFFDCQEDTRSNTNVRLERWSSMELIPVGEDSDDLDRDHEKSVPDGKAEDRDSIFSQGYIQKCTTAHLRRTSRSLASPLLRPCKRPTSPSASPALNASRPANALLMVFYGGSLLDGAIEPAARLGDFATLRTSLDAVSRQHYTPLAGSLALRLVPCPPLCADALAVLSSLCPGGNGDDSPVSGISTSPAWPPLGCLPLLAATAPDYAETVNRVIQSANQVYAEFIKSPEGLGFSGQVSVLADAVGSVVLFDSLCKNPNGPSRFGSENSIVEDAEDHVTEHDAAEKQETAPLTPGITRNRLFLQAPTSRRRSSCSRWSQSQPEDKATNWTRPHCNQIYNLYHPIDPLAARLEPLLSARFTNVQPVSVPRYQRFPLGDGKSGNLADFVQTNLHIFNDTATSSHPGSAVAGRRASDASILHGSNNSLAPSNEVLTQLLSSLSQRWWGSKRLDYVLYCPEGITAFPPSALPHLLHSSFWESPDVSAFILRQLMRTDASGGFYDLGSDKNDLTQGLPFSPSQPCEKWLLKRTSVKIKNIGANHRANDVIVCEGMPQRIIARFMYGPLDIVTLSGEKVDVHLLRDAATADWELVGSEVTDKAGRLVFTLPADRTMGLGLHPIKLVVRGDHTYADLYMAVLPPKTQAVVFSIDGSFTASMSVTGRDPKVRAGAVDVVRHWQELGYLIIYITGRPDLQQRRVVAWLAQHNFPHGLLSFADGLSTDPLRHKAEYLKYLVNDVGLEIRAAYGSSKDITVYSSVGLKQEHIFIVGKVSRKQQGLAQVLSEGYASHLAALATVQCRPAQINPCVLLPKGCLSLPGHGAPLLRRSRNSGGSSGGRVNRSKSSSTDGDISLSSSSNGGSTSSSRK
nr:EOG090X00NX [Eulimnadia texana]